MPTLKNGLTPTQAAFIPAYIKHGMNGTKALLSIKPHLSVESAQVESSKMLSQPMVQEYMLSKFEQQTEKQLSSRSFLTKQAHDLGILAEAKEEYRTALQAVDIKAKINRVYTEEAPDSEGYKTLIQQIMVNINPTQSKVAPVQPDASPIVDAELTQDSSSPSIQDEVGQGEHD